MDLRKVKSLIDLVSESDISELEISEGPDKVKIVKSSKATKGTHIGKSEDHYIMDRQTVGSKNDVMPTEDERADDKSSTILSPMVGTFYRAPSPSSKPFVSVGDEIKEGQTLCVVEAMKLMNEIPSDKTGVIREVLVENGQPVEYGQVLFRID
ncbi:acetyl-CoA carboxylase biotin carboxyl carrier protein [Betaproteobacteria bacterium]|nr:acetyl-CoA carboxylase biotin carboxyl carrier protein [Betaproteobacteria bacterium]